MSDLTVSSFKSILAASAAREVTTLPFTDLLGPLFQRLGGPSGEPRPLVTYATPSLLFADVTLRKPTGQTPSPPIAGHPFFAR